MRCLLTARLDTEKGNQLIGSGRIAQVLQDALGDIKPEAAYFAPSAGRRTIFLIVDLADASELVAKLEPLWLTTGAEVDVIPVMVQEDLERGMQALGPNLGKYTSH
jgi:hypothetical protein